MTHTIEHENFKLTGTISEIKEGIERIPGEVRNKFYISLWKLITQETGICPVCAENKDRCLCFSSMKLVD